MDSLYFPRVQLRDLDRVDQVRLRQPEKPMHRLGPSSQSSCSVKDFYDSEDDVFILLNRNLARAHLGTAEMR